MATIRPISANSTEAKVVDLSTRILETVKSMIGGDRNESEADFGHLLDRVKDLFGRRHTLTATGG